MEITCQACIDCLKAGGVAFAGRQLGFKASVKVSRTWVPWYFLDSQLVGAKRVLIFLRFFNDLLFNSTPSPLLLIGIAPAEVSQLPAHKESLVNLQSPVILQSAL